MTYFLIHLGCQMNTSDAERIRSVLHAMGYAASETEEDADLLGIVACSVRQKAIDKVYSKIAKWNSWKNRKSLLTFVTGCILSEDREKFLRRFDLVFSINELPELPDLIAQCGVVTEASLSLRSPSVRERADAESELRAAEPNGESPPAAVRGRRRPAGPAWQKDRPAHGLAFAPEQAPEGIRNPGSAAAARENTKRIIEALRTGLENRGGADAVKRAVLPADSKPDPLDGFWRIAPSYQSPFEAFIPIQNGCDKFCTFCAVPYTRGREVSRPSSEILAEFESLIERGYRSVTLLGQNVNSYGRDRAGSELSFPELMERIGEIGDRAGGGSTGTGRTGVPARAGGTGETYRAGGTANGVWVYFTSPHPRDMTVELLEVIARHRCLAKQIHLPIQSGDDEVLRRMNRGYTLDWYRSVVGDIRRILPDASLFTDIIVGFTGETENQFENTRKAMEEFAYDMAFIAMYSPRPGAASARWDDDIPHEEKKRRLAVLSATLQDGTLARHRSLVGRTRTVLVESCDPDGGWIQGRTEGRLNIRAPFPPTHCSGGSGPADTAAAPPWTRTADPQILVGTFVEMRVAGARPMSLEGELVTAGPRFAERGGSQP